MDELQKSYVGTLGGVLNAVDEAALVARTQPPAAPNHERGSAPPGGQPGEGVGDGSMVRTTPSASGTGDMVVAPVAGTPN